MRGSVSGCTGFATIAVSFNARIRKTILRLAMKNEIVTIGAFAALTFIEPYAAVGALGGVCFFLAMPSSLEWWRLMLLTVSSGLMGYAAGVSEWGTNNMMLTSSVVSALGVAFLASVKSVLKDRIMDVITLIINWRK